jgi:hypothetical protein
VSSFLLRVELPDVPGSLGRLAAAIGATGANIEAIEIVEHRNDGYAVDDVFVQPPPGVMPDSIVSACISLDGVAVQWISRYTAGENITRDLEVVEAMTEAPRQAVQRLVSLVPETFRVDWAMALDRTAGAAEVVARSGAAPRDLPEVAWPEALGNGHRVELPEPYQDLLVAACPLAGETIVVIARSGGPRILDSEIARLCHLAGLAGQIGQASGTA